MAFKRDNELDMEQVAAFLKDAVAKVESDPESLDELKKIFKKNVPLTRRNYVAAYLLKQCSGSIYRFAARKAREEKFASRRENREENTARRSSRYEERKARDTETSPAQERPAAEPREHFTRVQIDPSLATTIFVGIGRNRRVYPRDLVGLFISVAGLERERIGDIRVLANYSFVQLFADDAEKAINALNGYDYRGRKLSVSFSRQKDEENEEVSAASDVIEERVPDVENTSAPIVDTYTATTEATMAEQAAFASAQEHRELTDEEILAARAPRSSSSADIM